MCRNAGARDSAGTFEVTYADFKHGGHNGIYSLEINHERNKAGVVESIVGLHKDFKYYQAAFLKTHEVVAMCRDRFILCGMVHPMHAIHAVDTLKLFTSFPYK